MPQTRATEVARRQSSPCTGKLSARPAGKPGFCTRSRRVCDDPFPATPFVRSRHEPHWAPSMRFLRHGGIYRSDVVSNNQNQTLGRDRAASRWSAPSPGKRTRREDHALLIVRDEFRPAIPRSGCSPAEPVSASPARAALTRTLSAARPKGDISTLLGRVTFLLCVDSDTPPIAPGCLR